MVHVAMFDAVNSIARRYRPYSVQLPAAATTSQEAAAATAAGTVLLGLFPQAEGEIKAALATYLAAIPNSDAKSDGIKLGEAVAARFSRRARTTARTLRTPIGQRPNPVSMSRPRSPSPRSGRTSTPFAMTEPSQFRPEPPIPLKSEQWAADYNEIKDLGGKASTRRSAKQTEDARFWLITGPQSTDPIVRQLVAAKQMSVIDSARFMALYAVALADAYIAVFDAKYHYEFWRPITAIRNGDIDGNPATELDATWQPIDNTPMHPEYPCAHCIGSAAWQRWRNPCSVPRTSPRLP